MKVPNQKKINFITDNYEVMTAKEMAANCNCLVDNIHRWCRKLNVTPYKEPDLDYTGANGEYTQGTYLVFYLITENRANATKRVLHTIPLHRENKSFMEIQRAKWLGIILENYKENRIQVRIINK